MIDSTAAAPERIAAIVGPRGVVSHGDAAPLLRDERRLILLSLARLNRIREVDRVGLTLIAETGVVLARAQEAELAAALDGSFSAEHGVGILKAPDLVRHKSPAALALMRTLEHALDLLGIMNPSKVL